MIIINDACLLCKHYRGYKDYQFRCDAFPDGIPSKIRDDLFDHRNPHPDDDGIQFEIHPDHEHESQRVEHAFKYIQGKIKNQEKIRQQYKAKLQEAFEKSDEDDFETFLKKRRTIAREKLAKAKTRRNNQDK